MLFNTFLSRNDQKFTENGIYSQYSSNLTPTEITPWKLHIFIDYRDEDEVEVAYNALMQYLIDWELQFKVIRKTHISRMRGHIQEGKFFTIYPSSISSMKSLAIQLDKLIFELIEDGMIQWKDCNITGDKKLDLLSGRVFYRYDLSTGEHKEKVAYLDKRLTDENGLSLADYNNLYEANRGDDFYLARDMSEEDDPFFNEDLELIQYGIVLDQKLQQGEPLNAEESHYLSHSQSIYQRITGEHRLY